MSDFFNNLKRFEEFKCPECRGVGTVNDADLGDIYFKEWACKPCDGTGFVDGAEIVPVPLNPTRGMRALGQHTIGVTADTHSFYHMALEAYTSMVKYFNQ